MLINECTFVVQMLLSNPLLILRWLLWKTVPVWFWLRSMTLRWGRSCYLTMESVTRTLSSQTLGSLNREGVFLIDILFIIELVLSKCIYIFWYMTWMVPCNRNWYIIPYMKTSLYNVHTSWSWRFCREHFYFSKVFRNICFVLLVTALYNWFDPGGCPMWYVKLIHFPPVVPWTLTF